MNKIISILLLTAVALTGCRKDVAIEPGSQTENSFPFENNNLKMEVVSTTVPSPHILDMHFFNEETGIVITYDGKIYKTTDKGISWSLKFSNPTPDQPLFQILFVNQDTGYVAGGANWCNGTGCTCPGGLVLKTTDGGETWTNVFQITGQLEFDGIAVNNNNELFLLQNGFSGPAQSQTDILKSSDGGINWTNVATLNYQLVKIVFNNNDGFCTGGSPNGDGRVLRSSDNGVTWIQSTTLSSYWTNDIAFADNVGYCLGNNLSISRTSDNGDNWAEVNHTEYGSYKLNPLTSTSCLVWGCGAYTGGCFGYTYGAVRQTTDAGNSWTETQFREIGCIRCSSFYSSTQGYVMADKLIKVTVK